MFVRRVGLPVLLGVTLAGALLPDLRRHVHATQQELPPVSYVCPMLADAEVLEDKPGRCPKCGMDLVPVRLDLAWSCPNHPAIIRDKAGKCPLDKRDLVEVTVALHWTCPEQPDTHLTGPGKCRGGKERTPVRELRAHGDHNPRHGGQFFMAADNWHHLEGTYPRDGLFRVYIYDNFTRPLEVKIFVGRAVTREDFDSATGRYRELKSFPLEASRERKTLEAKITNGTLPLRVTAKLKLDKNLPEQRFDFTFPEYSREPPSAPASTSLAWATPPRGAATRTAEASPKPTPATRARSTAASATSAAGSGSQAAPRLAVSASPSPTQASEQASSPQAAPNILATAVTTAFRPEEVLPSTSAELLALLATRSLEVQTAIQSGQFGAVYVPALSGKNIVLALESHATELPDQRRIQASDAVKRLVLAAWRLDFYGDRGNREKLTETYNLFVEAAADIKAAYDAQR